MVDCGGRPEDWGTKGGGEGRGWGGGEMSTYDNNIMILVKYGVGGWDVNVSSCRFGAIGGYGNFQDVSSSLPRNA